MNTFPLNSDFEDLDDFIFADEVASISER